MTDALRQRYAEALARRLRADTIAPNDTVTTSNSLTPHEYDLADVVLAVRDDELEPLRAAVAHYENTITWNTTCHGCAAALDAAYAETVRAEQAEAAIARVRAAHPRVDDGYGPECRGCGNPVAGIVTWPCPTIRALDDPAVSEEETGSGDE